MFYSGDLQSGIALALQESKLVVCFLTDEGSESLEWQDNFLTDEDVSAALKERAIVLRLKADSQEATFLKAYYPISSIPSLIVIQYKQPYDAPCANHLLILWQEWSNDPRFTPRYNQKRLSSSNIQGSQAYPA